MAEIIKSTELCKSVKTYIRQKITSSGITPRLKIYTTNLDPASVIYVNAKKNACDDVGIHCEIVVIESKEVLKKSLMEDFDMERTHGVLVQKPTIKGFKDEWVDPSQDVDGFHPKNVGLLFLGYDKTLSPCTPHGVMLWMKKLINPKGKHAVIVGRSAIVGRPMASLCMQEDMAVTLIHKRSLNNQAIARSADVLIVAAGSPGLVTKDWVKQDAVVFDVGINRLPNGKIVGDVNVESVKEKAKYITSVPGGVGPMTVTMVLWNTCTCAGIEMGSLDEFWETV